MSKYNDIREDDVQIIGHAPRKDTPAPNTRRRNSGVAIISAIIVTIIGILAIVFWPKENPENPYDGVFENSEPVENKILENNPKNILGDVSETTKCYTERLDTIINDVHLAIYIPHNASPELLVGRPDSNRKDIILLAQAADIRADNHKILGAFVLKGEPLAWGVSKKGFCAIIDGKMTVGVSENSPLFEEATEKGGYFFRQFPLVDKGDLVENEVKKKSMRKALCHRYGQFFIAVSETDESYHDFAQALIDLGVENAISLVGSHSAYGWSIDGNGNQVIFSEDDNKYKNESYLLWK